MSRKASLTEQSIFLITGQVLAFLLSIAVPMVLVRVFSREKYGLYQQLFLIFTTVLPIGQLGVTQGLYYFLPREPDKRDSLMMQTLAFVMVLGGVFCLALTIFRNEIASAFNSPEMITYLPLLGAYTFFMISSSFIETSMIAEGRVIHASLFNVVSEAGRSTIVVVSAFLSRDILVVLYGVTAFSLFRFMFQFFYLRKRYRISPRNVDLEFWRRQLSYSLPVGFSNVAWLIQMKLHSFFVSFLFSTQMFAVYSVGSFNLPIVGIITTAVANVMTPEMSRCQKEGKDQQIIEIWHNAFRKMNLIFFPTFVFFFIMADEFILLLFTDKYEASIPIFRVSLLGILMSGINVGAVLNAYAQTRYEMTIAFVRLPVTMVLLYVFTNLWGVLGAIGADVFVSYLFRAVALQRVADVLSLSFGRIFEWRKNGIALCIAGVAGIPLLGLKNFAGMGPFLLLAVSAVIFCFCYVGLSIAFGTLSKAEVRSLVDLLLRRFVPLRSGPAFARKELGGQQK
jgi:O-antigen/teichoic acid export membrane protein